MFIFIALTALTGGLAAAILFSPYGLWVTIIMCPMCASLVAAATTLYLASRNREDSP
jgi:hypothetical protein